MAISWKKLKNAVRIWDGGKKMFLGMLGENWRRKKLLAKVEAEAMRRGDNSWLRELRDEIHVLMDKET